MNKFEAFYNYVSEKIKDNDKVVRNASEVLNEIKALVNFVEVLGADEK